MSEIGKISLEATQAVVEGAGSVERRRVKEILEKLNPERFVDEEGNEREAYTFRSLQGYPVKVVFYSPEELPFSKEIVKNKQAFVLGEKPKYRANEEWQSFISKVEEGPGGRISPTETTPEIRCKVIKEGKALIFVESRPSTLLDLAFALGVENKKLEETGAKARNRILTEEGQKITDQVIAAKSLDDEGNFKEEINYEGEALATLSLLGDEEAKEFLESHHQALTEKDRCRKQVDSLLGKISVLSKPGELYNSLIDALSEELGEKQLEEVKSLLEASYSTSDARKLRNWWENYLQETEGKTFDRLSSRLVEIITEKCEGLSLDNLVAVHLTHYLPKESNGNLEMISAFDATDWKMPRNTIHFALNHPVAPHMYGSWEDAPYAIIAPLDGLMKLNGKPVNLNTVDTFFEVSPGTRLYLPEETVIVKPSELPKGELFHSEGKEVIYKASNIAPEDIATLVDRLSKWDRHYLNEDVTGIICEYLRWHKENPLSEEELDRLSQASGPVFNREDVLSILTKQPLVEVVKGTLKKAEVLDKLSPEIVADLINKAEGKFIAQIKEQAIRDRIRQMGYEDQPGGMWAWGGSWEVTRQTHILGAKIGIAVGPHSADISSQLMDDVLRAQNVLSEHQERNLGERLSIYKEVQEEVISKLFPNLSQKSRRMLYLIGFL